VHDTTKFSFGAEETREGLGPLLHKNGVRGFFSHVSLALSLEPAGYADPLGIVHVHNYVRSNEPTASKRVKTLEDESNEYRRWLTSADEASKRLDAVRPIHVMDREADIYELFAALTARDMRFVIRSSDDRATPERIAGTKAHVKLSAVLRRLEGVVERVVPLSRRSDYKRLPSDKRIHPAREGRLARLRFSAGPIELLKPAPLPAAKLPRTLALHIVHVLEVDPPNGESPVEWRLLTTEPIDTVDDVERIVDIYRQRWCIEELFKALKTGCAFEKRQFRSFDALQRLLAVLLPIAWCMLRMRTLAKAEPDRPAAVLFSPEQLALLRITTRRGPLPDHPTVHDVMYAIAGLGGHLKRNGPPGWQTLGRGLDRFLDYEVGWRAARHADCDLS
jgi:IS4 transposase